MSRQRRQRQRRPTVRAEIRRDGAVRHRALPPSTRRVVHQRSRCRSRVRRDVGNRLLHGLVTYSGPDTAARRSPVLRRHAETARRIVRAQVRRTHRRPPRTRATPDEQGGTPGRSRSRSAAPTRSRAWRTAHGEDLQRPRQRLGASKVRAGQCRQHRPPPRRSSTTRRRRSCRTSRSSRQRRRDVDLEAAGGRHERCGHAHARAQRNGSRRRSTRGRHRVVRDSGLKAGVAYRYRLTSLGRGGQPVGRPGDDEAARALRAGGRASRHTPGPHCAGTPTRARRYYNLQLYRGSKKVLSSWPVGTSFRLPKQLDLRRPPLQADARQVPLVRLARSRRARTRAVRQAARQQLLRRPLTRAARRVA